jgi:hypothetical protein
MSNLDVTNPGVVNVADEVAENPDPNNSIRLLVPEELDALTDAADQGYVPAGNGVDSTVFPTPKEVTITQVPTDGTVLSTPTPQAQEVNVQDSVLGQGVWKTNTEQLRLISVQINVTQAFVSSTFALGVGTVLEARQNGFPTPNQFGSVVPTALVVVNTGANVLSDGSQVNYIVHLRSAGGPVLFSDLSAGTFTITLTYNDGSTTSFSVTLLQLQALGAVSDAEVALGNLKPAASFNTGTSFVPPDEFLVVGPDQSINTNYSAESTVICTVTAVYDADNLWNSPTNNTTRYLLAVAPPALSSYPISVLGRPIVFTDDTVTQTDAGAARIITGLGTNFVVINKNDPFDTNTPTLDDPAVGDTFILDVQRQGAEDIQRTNIPTVDVVIAPPPPTFVPGAGQALSNQGTVDISTGQQPGEPIITSGVDVPTAINVFVADQSLTVGLPVNVNV